MPTQSVILAGGLGTRLREETSFRPKPMADIGHKPVLWHIMKLYSAYGIHDFIICAGYKGYMIKEYFANYFLHNSDISFRMHDNSMEVHQRHAEPWNVTIVDTGETTMTGGRLKRISPYLNGETFCMTYGDGLSNVDITALLASHREAGKLVTITAVQPPGRFGALHIEEEMVTHFMEKPPGEAGWINGGFFVLEPQALSFIEGDQTIWEKDPLETLAAQQQLHAFFHRGFWQPMDTMRDKDLLEQLWDQEKAPWKVW